MLNGRCSFQDRILAVRKNNLNLCLNAGYAPILRGPQLVPEIYPEVYSDVYPDVILLEKDDQNKTIYVKDPFLYHLVRHDDISSKLLKRAGSEEAFLKELMKPENWAIRENCQRVLSDNPFYKKARYKPTSLYTYLQDTKNQALMRVLNDQIIQKHNDPKKLTKTFNDRFDNNSVIAYWDQERMRILNDRLRETNNEQERQIDPQLLMGGWAPSLASQNAYNSALVQNHQQQLLLEDLRKQANKRRDQSYDNLQSQFDQQGQILSWYRDQNREQEREREQLLKRLNREREANIQLRREREPLDDITLEEVFKGENAADIRAEDRAIWAQLEKENKIKALNKKRNANRVASAEAAANAGGVGTGGGAYFRFGGDAANPGDAGTGETGGTGGFRFGDTGETGGTGGTGGFRFGDTGGTGGGAYFRFGGDAANPGAGGNGGGFSFGL